MSGPSSDREAGKKGVTSSFLSLLLCSDPLRFR